MTTLLKNFPALVTQVTDLHPETDTAFDSEDTLRYRVKAEQTGPIDQQRVSVHFTLKTRDGAPCVGSVLLVTIADQYTDAQIN